MSCIAVLAFVLLRREGGLTGMLPGVQALSAQRLLPAFQQVYAGHALFVGNQASIADIVTLLEQPLPEHAGSLATGRADRAHR